MIDVIGFTPEMQDLDLFDTNLMQARNCMITQLEGLQYDKEFGIDRSNFLTSLVQFQLESFKNHTIEQLAKNGIIVNNVVQLELLFEMNFNYFINRPEQ